MSKLDRDIKGIMEEAFEAGEKLVSQMVPILIDDDIDEDEKMQKLSEAILGSKPKTYDDYIHDIKQAFKNDGWTPPEAEQGKQS
jgi:hypothetical protein